MVQVCIARRHRQALAQDRFRRRLAPLLTPGIREVDVGTVEARVQRNGALESSHRLFGASLALIFRNPAAAAVAPLASLFLRMLLLMTGLGMEIQLLLNIWEDG